MYNLTRQYFEDELRVLQNKPWWNNAEDELKDWLQEKALERAEKRAKEELHIKDE
jgi:hypothetical protein